MFHVSFCWYTFPLVNLDLFVLSECQWTEGARTGQNKAKQDGVAVSPYPAQPLILCCFRQFVLLFIN